MKFSVTATGDVLLTKGYQEGGYDGIEEVKNYLNRGDAIIGNLETCVTDYDTYCSAYCGGTWLSTTPRVLKQSLNFGFNMMGFSNNHTMDFGPDGLLETIEHVNKHDIALAGVGKTLAEAAEPVYRTFKGGRVAFIALTSSFTDAARAGYASKFLKGRPGLNPLRFNQYFTVTQEHFDVLKEITKNTYMNGQRDKARANGFEPQLPEGTLDFGGISIKLSQNGKEEKINHPHEEDMERTIQSIKDARYMADYVFVMVHSHQIRRDEMFEADHFLEEFSRKCIDAGADAIFGGGTHEFKGIEIYNGKPIFYSLGDFAFQVPFADRLPEDIRINGNYGDISDAQVLKTHSKNLSFGLWIQPQTFKSVIPYLEFEDGKLVSAELQPIELGFNKPKHQKGVPYIATKEQAKDIYDILTRLSAEYGTTLTLNKDNTIKIEL